MELYNKFDDKQQTLPVATNCVQHLHCNQKAPRIFAIAYFPSGASGIVILPYVTRARRVWDPA